MRRRDVLFVIGGVDGGSSLIIGSSAFTTVEAEREFDVNIVDDEGEAFASGEFPEQFTVTTYQIDDGGPTFYDTDGDGESASEADATSQFREHLPADAGSYNRLDHRASDVHSDLEGYQDGTGQDSQREDGGYIAIVEDDEGHAAFGSTTDDDGLMRVKNRIPAAIIAQLTADHDHIECRPDSRMATTDDEATITGGEVASFNALADCRYVDADGEPVNIIARLNHDDDEAVSASIEREVEVSREVWIAVVFSCTDARIRLATDRGQPGEHLQAEPPIDVTATFVDGPDRHTETATLWEIDELPWEPQGSYDKIERLEIDGKENRYTFENSLTEILEKGAHSGWQCNKNWTSETV